MGPISTLTYLIVRVCGNVHQHALATTNARRARFCGIPLYSICSY